MKKLAVLVLILTCIISFASCSNVNSTHDIPANTTKKTNSLMEVTQIYLETELKLSDASFALGSQLSAYRLEKGKLETIDYEKYPVLVDNRVIAFATCTLGETGEYITGCGKKYADTFWQEYSAQPDVAIAIVYALEGVYLVREGDAPILLHEMPLPDLDSIKELDKYCGSLVYSPIQIPVL